MNLYKKSLLALSTLIAIAPGLHATSIEQEQTKLIAHISSADVQGFKTTFDALQDAHQLDEFKAMCTALVEHAQITKIEIQEKLTALGNKKTNKTMLAKGIAQTIFGTSAAILLPFLAYTFFSAPTQLDEAGENLDDNLQLLLMCASIPAYPFPMLYEPLNYLNLEHHLKKLPLGKAQKVYFCGLPIAGFLALKYGMQNCKHGYNYAAYLEKQIKHLDEIVEVILAES